MPKLESDQVPVIKLDGAGMSLQVSLTPEQCRGLFERPGSEVVGLVVFRSCMYTGHAASEEKDPAVKVRAVLAEMARDDDQATALREAMRAMFRRREIDGTLDAAGPGPQDVAAVLGEATAGYPSEGDLRAHRDRHGARGRTRP